MLFVGPFDLGNNIGHSIDNGTMHDELKEAIAKIQRAAKENKKSSGIYATSGDQAREFADQGFNMVSPPATVTVSPYCRSTLWMSSICKRPGITDPLTLHPGVSDDGYGCTADAYDFCIDDCQRFVCSFSTEYGQGGNVRACKDDRVT